VSARSVAFRPGGVLLRRAREALAERPRTADALAREVLGLRGHPGVAARAVQTLLGDDPRFSLSPNGLWRFREDRDGTPAASLHDARFAVVDVETTGGGATRGDRITEISIVPVEGGRVGRPFTTLVNPERPIPGMITRLTSITNEMVATAPRFAEIAHRVCEALEGRVFVAHNAGFDWRFLTAEFDRLAGRRPEGSRLCTVRAGRRLLPGLSSHALDSVTTYFGITIEGRHRAEGDAVATARLLVRYLDLLEEQEIHSFEALERWLSPPRKRKKKRRTPVASRAPKVA